MHQKLANFFSKNNKMTHSQSLLQSNSRNHS